MTATPNTPDDSGSSAGGSPSPSSDTPGAEIGINEDEGSSFEPEEDPGAHDSDGQDPDTGA